jgi:Collagenase and related proteases
VWKQEALKAAVAYNADAVYLGVDKFNARMKTDNFTLEELPDCINFAHLFGTKVYVTLNTLIKENEFEEACAIADKIYISNADGLILTDLGLINYCLSRYKNIEIFLSTQLSVSNIYAAEFAQKIGCTGIVLARESSLTDIKEIAAKTDLKIETFIHGAMCVCVSGQCYMSSMADGNSGNRGRCAQPCRKKYFAYNNGKLIGQKYYLSMRDMNSTSTIKTLIDSGVKIFKTEGRNRRPEYVAQSVLTYKNLL